MWGAPRDIKLTLTGLNPKSFPVVFIPLLQPYLFIPINKKRSLSYQSSPFALASHQLHWLLHLSRQAEGEVGPFQSALQRAFIVSDVPSWSQMKMRLNVNILK